LPTDAESPAAGRPDCDVAIVGGGPAGIATALFLCHADPRRRGRVVVLEKETYPRDKFCAGGLGARADLLLGSIGVHVDVPSVPIDGVSLKLPAGEVCRREGRIGRVVRRLEYDHELSLLAARRGVRIEENAKVTGLRVTPDGVVVDSPKGSLRAKVVVGADGVGSFVRRALGLPIRSLLPSIGSGISCTSTRPTELSLDMPGTFLRSSARTSSCAGVFIT
jgi:flavin-dependent dehydrogenase